MRLPDLLFEELVLDQLATIRRMIGQLSQALAAHDKKENTNMAVTQADVDALTARVDADNAVEATALQGIKDDLAALKEQAPDLDLTDLSAKVDALDQAAAQEQQVATDNAPPPTGAPTA
jgi:hypothetical protein